MRGRDIEPERVARFLDRVVFSLFAEDVGLLPNKVFTRVVENTQGDPERFSALVANLFEQMAGGGHFGADTIAHFNGNLFEATEVLDLTADELRDLLAVSHLDWSNIDASIFGTLFERALDPDKRSQLGTHYTSREDIETIVDPVVMTPLRNEWQDVRARFDELVNLGEKSSAKAWRDARALIRGFLDRLSGVTILDPACGSGNFLFVALQKLKDLEKEVIVHSSAQFPFFPQVGPWQLRGIELNAYAFELAQMTAWIGHLQWHNRHGMPLEERPILRQMTNFERKDAVLSVTEDGVEEPVWPEAEFIVSNPPFLGGKRLRDNLGDHYVRALFSLWSDRVPPQADYCCYWFEKARAAVKDGQTRRVGLLATQGIRSGANREVLRRIKESGDIFFGISDRDWVLDGAMVHVSMVGYDDGTERTRCLDGAVVTEINPDLTTGSDATTAARLPANDGVSFMGDTKGGAFDVESDQAAAWLLLPNPHGRPNSDVLRPWVNGADLTKRNRGMWIVDFVPGTASREAARYEAPFAYVKQAVAPARSKNRRAVYAEKWWIHAEARPEMRQKLAVLPRYLATTRVSKHRIFTWLQPEVLADSTVVVFARADDYTFGVLHSRIHDVWARATGSQLREEESGFRYTATSTFGTFPFPDVDHPQKLKVAEAARELDAVRSRWLNPPEWLQPVALTFPASASGLWAHRVRDVNGDGIGTAEHTRLVALDEAAERALKKRTLTDLYNDPPSWVRDLHEALEAAVSEAYGLPRTVSEAAVMEHLLTLNRERSARSLVR